MMSTATVVNRQLLDIAGKLVVDYSDHTAGSVLRCFARAVRRSRKRGVPLAALPVVSEALARAMLERRPSVPRPRRAS